MKAGAVRARRAGRITRWRAVLPAEKGYQLDWCLAAVRPGPESQLAACTRARSAEELQAVLKSAWDEFPQALIDRYVLSFQSRLARVRRMQGQ